MYKANSQLRWKRGFQTLRASWILRLTYLLDSAPSGSRRLMSTAMLTGFLCRAYNSGGMISTRRLPIREDAQTGNWTAKEQQHSPDLGSLMSVTKATGAMAEQQARAFGTLLIP